MNFLLESSPVTSTPIFPLIESRDYRRAPIAPQSC
jgi:hypothetical protein